MNKIVKLGVGFAFASSLLVSGVALAAINTTFLTLNGNPNATVPLGNTAQANVTYDLDNTTTTSDAESLSWQIRDGAGNAALPPVCVDISDRTTGGTFNTSFPIGTGGQTEGTWDVFIRIYGQPGTGADNNCNGTIRDSKNFPNVLTITTPSDSSTAGGNPFSGQSTAYCALYPWTCQNSNTGGTNYTGYNQNNPFGGTNLPVFCQQYPAACGITTQSPGTTPPPATNPNAAKCALVAPYRNAAAYQYTTAGQQLQSALMLDNPHAIPALDASLHPQGTVPLGFFGIQTHAALNAFDAMYHCI